MGLRVWMLAMACAAALAGCDSGGPVVAGSATQKVPKPLDLLLPREIRIHPFTRTFSEANGEKGLEIRVEMIDGYKDTTKAFGDIRFELYAYRPQSADPKGALLSSWDVSLMNPKDNLVHWDHIWRAYLFKLQMYAPPTAGQKMVLVTTFSSPYTPRLFAEQVITAGQ